MPKRKRPLSPAQREAREAREIDKALNVIDRNVKARRKREAQHEALFARVESRLRAVGIGKRKASKRKAAKRKVAKRVPRRKASKRKVAKRAPRRKASKRKVAKRRVPKRRPLELARARREAARRAYDKARTPAAKARARAKLEMALIKFGEAERRAGF